MRTKSHFSFRGYAPTKSYVAEFLDKLREKFWFRVLVVEDSRESRNLLRMAMDTLPCSIDFTSNGRSAQHLLKKNPPYDLIILDQDLPDTHGFRVLEALDGSMTSDEDSSRPVPFIVYSGLDLQPMESMRDFKFADYIKKPTNLSAINQRIEKVLKTRQPGVGQNL
jgi:CheY-like chemotaxis protein